MKEDNITLKISEKAKNNKFIDCKVFGNVEVNGHNNIFFATKIYNIGKKYPKISISVIIAIISLFVEIYAEFFHNSNSQIEVKNSPNSINTIGQIGDNIITADSSRTLNDSQRKILKDLLLSKEPGKVAFKSKLFDREAENYANQLADAFKSSGWEIGLVAKDLLDDFDGKINVFKTGTSSPDGTNVYLVDSFPALDSAGILYKSEMPRIGSFGGNLQENTLYFEIGSK